VGLINVDELKARVPTDLGDSALGQIIDEEEAEVVRRFGAHADDGTVIETIDSEKACNVFLPRRIDSVSSITEGDGITQTALAVADYRVWPKEGRLERIATLGTTIEWQPHVIVTYTPQDDKKERQRVLLELCRISVERQVMRKETVGQQDYSYQSPDDWERERENVLSKLQHFLIIG
jgi:hypothetical protein